jgi:murein DD-endopeptidase MepM/ murein hydrolase activator NlpD
MVTSLLILVATVALQTPPISSVADLPKLLLEEFDLLEALDSLDQDRVKQERALSTNKKRLKEVIIKRDLAMKRHAVALALLRRERKRIKRRIRVFLEMKDIEDWQMLASAGDYATYLRTKRFLGQIIKGDEARIKKYHVAVKRFRDAQAELDKQLQDLKRIEKGISESRTTLERDKAIKAALLESVRSEKKYHLKANRDHSRAAKTLREKIAKFEQWQGKRLWFRDLKGKFLPPLPGAQLVKGYGNKTHPRFGTVTMHRGMEYLPARRRSKDVRSIYWGKVVHAGWLRGYGNTVIVDHTEGDYTLYAHLKTMNVKKGDLVKTREAVGSVGSTGSLKGERLYFELRIAGKPVNPARWFR